LSTSRFFIFSCSSGCVTSAKKDSSNSAVSRRISARPGGGAEDQRALVDGLLEVLADRLAIDQREVLLLELQHRRAAGGLQA
jgi:hypothetical protein